jgi:hypothetical protein
MVLGDMIGDDDSVSLFASRFLVLLLPEESLLSSLMMEAVDIFRREAAELFRICKSNSGLPLVKD